MIATQKKMVEIAFTMVHSNYRGNGIMKTLVNKLIAEAKSQNFEWVFGKVHKDNFASSRSLINNAFYKHCDYKKLVKIETIKTLLSFNVLSNKATRKIEDKLKLQSNETFIQVDYQILLKKL